MTLGGIVHKLVHYFDTVADEFWKLTFHQAASKFQLLCVLIIIFIGFVTFTNNALRTYLEQYARPDQQVEQDELELGMQDPEPEVWDV